MFGGMGNMGNMAGMMKKVQKMQNEMKKMQEAMEKGFKQATKTWGRDLPEISSKTYDAVMDKFDKWAEESAVI